MEHQIQFKIKTFERVKIKKLLKNSQPEVTVVK